jgi:hypothetical protein
MRKRAYNIGRALGWLDSSSFKLIDDLDGNGLGESHSAMDFHLGNWLVLGWEAVRVGGLVDLDAWLADDCRAVPGVRRFWQEPKTWLGRHWVAMGKQHVPVDVWEAAVESALRKEGIDLPKAEKTE